MRPTKGTLFTFAKSLPSRCEKERDIIVTSGSGAWDTRIRKSFWDAVAKWFCQDFELSIEEARHYVYVEGLNHLPDNMRGGAFFGSKMYPDAALILRGEPLVAIELDHGTRGDRMRNALAKASFSVLLAEYNRAMVLFFVESDMPAAHFRKQDNEKRILELYRRYFSTTLYLI